MLNRRMKPVAAAVGTAFVASLAGVSFADVQEHPFGAVDQGSGYDLLAKGDAEGKCGEGKCGEEKDAEGKCGEGKGAEAKDAEGKCGEGKCGEGSCGADEAGGGKDAEGKCGEGKCGEAA